MPLYKNTHLDIDVNNKSDRIEWGHARYQATFRPDQAYEMCIQWAIASGNIVAELVSVAYFLKDLVNFHFFLIVIPY